MLPRFGAKIVATFSLPSFYDNFENSNGIVDTDLANDHRTALQNFLAEL